MCVFEDVGAGAAANAEKPQLSLGPAMVGDIFTRRQSRSIRVMWEVCKV